jgi:calcineurin-like phosphoesterase family protein
MANKHLITVNNIFTESELDNFAKAVTSNYVNVKAGENIFLILTDDIEKPKDIFEKIYAKNNGKVSFLVLQFDNWYGELYDEAFDWLEEKFPQLKLIKE